MILNGKGGPTCCGPLRYCHVSFLFNRSIQYGYLLTWLFLCIHCDGVKHISSLCVSSYYRSCYFHLHCCFVLDHPITGVSDIQYHRKPKLTMVYMRAVMFPFLTGQFNIAACV